MEENRPMTPAERQALYCARRAAGYRRVKCWVESRATTGHIHSEVWVKQTDLDDDQLGIKGDGEPEANAAIKRFLSRTSV
jgi:hypothetical protein